jgi:hypothetical protein
VNNPIPFAYLRAPYLHNGSVPTLRQLIGLDDRQSHFCRGANVYDPESVGLVAPAWDEPSDCPADLAFPFDTGLPGNSNAGHRYPWPPKQAGDHREELEALLAYLRTL